MRFVLAFGLCGTALAALAVRLARQATGVWWVLVAVEVYFAVCLVSVAVAYGLREMGLGVEDYLLLPGWSLLIRTALMPYLAVGAITLYLARWFDREGLLNPVALGALHRSASVPLRARPAPAGRYPSGLEPLLGVPPALGDRSGARGRDGPRPDP